MSMFQLSFFVYIYVCNSTEALSHLFLGLCMSRGECEIVIIIFFFIEQHLKHFVFTLVLYLCTRHLNWQGKRTHAHLFYKRSMYLIV